MVLGFFELPDEDRPPEELWLDEERISQHFEDVKARRNEKYGVESVPDADMMQNELTRGLR